MIEEDIPAQAERWSPDGPGEDTSILTPQADRTETQMKHERESTGRTLAPNLKQRNEDYELNLSPVKEGFSRNATTSGEWQPTIPAVVEDEEMGGQPDIDAQLIARDERMRNRMLRAGEVPKYQGQGRGLLQGATVQFL
eukprot:1370684-Pyramimonas_sp.AAC.1